LITATRARKLNSALLRDIEVLYELDRKGRVWSEKNYVGGYTSYGSVTDLHVRHAPFQELKSLIDRKVSTFIKTLDLDLMGGKTKMTTCWVNVMPPGAHHSLHLHPLSFVSGTYYVDIPRGSSPLKFEDPRAGLFMARPPARRPSHSVVPKSGHLVLFESWLRHEVSAQNVRYPRISVSFNYEWN